MSCKQGETVKLTFSSADASVGAALVITDANGATRTLAANERLLIDNLSGVMDVLAVSAIVTGTTVLAVVGNGAGFEADGEGVAAEHGITPTVTTAAGGQVDLAGSGRVIQDGSLLGVTRPAWKDSLPGR